MMTRIIIELEGGLVTEVYCSDPDADVSVIDRDVLEEGDIESEEEEQAWIRKALPPFTLDRQQRRPNEPHLENGTGNHVSGGSETGL
jgi:hypothetical protein